MYDPVLYFQRLVQLLMSLAICVRRARGYRSIAFNIIPSLVDHFTFYRCLESFNVPYNLSFTNSAGPPSSY